jgi:D-beta-D-heptose 7-phosphate kinase/D-beta-D-heptose 1-phosphate adenosyltransferase
MELLQRFAQCLDRNDKAVFIHIIGDSILDDDYQVKVSRISPECANVHVLLSENDIPFRRFPGGAANVCYQLNNFNIVSRLFTFIDPEAYRVIRNHGIKYLGGVDLPKGSYIPRKKRFYEKGFQVVARWDIELPRYGLDDAEFRQLQAKLASHWQIFQIEPDVMIFSDYNKGIFSGDFKLSWYDTKAVTIVDPKAAPLDRWAGCTVFKPNSKEAEVLSGHKDWQRQCDFFQKELNCKAVVITQEGDGVVGKTGDYFEYRPKCNVKPMDIIGAGDCFIGVLGLAISHGFSFEDAAKIAFHGGLMYVQQKQRGTFGPWSFHSHGKILKNWEFLKNREYKLVFTNGCFDLIHSGHLQTLEFAKSKGDKLVLGVNSDDSIRRLKGDSRPILPLLERMKLLAALDCVDYVIPFEEDTPQRLIEDIKPDVLVKGADWIGKEVAGMDCVKEVCYVPLVEGHSTSEIIKKIKSS